MRPTRAICVVIALCGLAGSVRAQYYPAPQPYYNPYNPYRPVYVPPPAYYPPQPGPVNYGPLLDPAQIPAAKPPQGPVYHWPLPEATETPAAPKPASKAVKSQPGPVYHWPLAEATQTPAVSPPALPPVEKVTQAQIVPAVQPETLDPETELPEETPAVVRRPSRVSRPVTYTIPEVLGKMPFEPPASAGMLWFKTEYLLWRVRNGPPHFPLVTTDTNPLLVNAGAINSPTAHALFGNDGFQYGTFNGMRGTIGFWCDSDQRFGIETSAFLNEKRAVHFSAGSDAAGNPPLYIPAFNYLRGAENALIVSDPTIPLIGTVDVVASLQLWGAEVNSVYTLARTDRWSIELLGGFRYLDLLETIDMQNQTSGFNAVAFITDHFQTRNQFYGAQLGARSNFTYNNWTGGLSAKIALGSTHEISEIRGLNAQAAGVGLGGFFSQPSNIGRSTLNAFSAVPQFGATLGYNVTPRVTVFASYDFLLWTYVARAGDQIDRVLNLSQSAQFGQGALANVIARPEPVFHHADFWAQGISLGLQYRY